MNIWISKISEYLSKFLELGVLLLAVSVIAEILFGPNVAFFGSQVTNNLINLLNLELINYYYTAGDFINLRSIQPGIHHSRTQMMRKYYSYSFSLEPEKWYSTGTVNFSHIKDQILKLRLNVDDPFGDTPERLLKVYALSYNILRIENGTTKLLFN